VSFDGAKSMLNSNGSCKQALPPAANVGVRAFSATCPAAPDRQLRRLSILQSRRVPSRPAAAAVPHSQLPHPAKLRALGGRNLAPSFDHPPVTVTAGLTLEQTPFFRHDTVSGRRIATDSIAESNLAALSTATLSQ